MLRDLPDERKDWSDKIKEAKPDTLFGLVELAGVPADLVDRLLQCHREKLAPLVWPEFEGSRGNPILFDRSLFAELREVRGDTGGRPVLLRHQDRTERVIVDDKSILQDFDRPEDLAATEFNVQSSRFKG